MSKLIYTKEVLEKAVQESFYYTEVFKKLGARLGGNTYQRIKLLIKKYDIDTSHFLNARLTGFLKSGIAEKKHHSLILTENLERARREGSKILRRALIDSGREYICEHCGIGPKWNNKDLTLHTDHIDGNWTDCRKENLRFLCPNCHSQTSTFVNKESGKNVKTATKK
jgi:rubrerythrin